MKKTCLCVVLSILMLAVCACAPAASVPAESQSAAAPSAENSAAPEETAEAEQGEMPPYAASVTMQEVNDEITADDGTVVMRITGSFPIVEVSEREPATAAISTYFQEEYDDYLKDEDMQFMIESAKEDYADHGKESPDMFPYQADRKYTVARADKTVLSFIEDEYSFTGGAHPNSTREAVNFDTATGKELEFKDIVTDEAAARDFVNEQLTKYLGEGDFGVFDDYKEHIDEILEDDTWYFDSLGVCIIINEYIVTPHASGIIEVTIPYAEFPQLIEDYSIVK